MDAEDSNRMTFRYRLKQRVEFQGSKDYWIAERMRQEVLHPELETFHINELYLVVPIGKDYQAFARTLDGGPPADYVDVDDIKIVE